MIFSIIIAACGRPERLLKTLAAIRMAIEADGKEHRVIIADNSREHFTPERAREFSKQCGVAVKCLQSEPGNKCKALNAGIAAADTEWLAFTDDDTLPDVNWLKRAAEYARRGDCRIFGGRIAPAKPEKALPGWLKPDRYGRVPFTEGILLNYAPLSDDGLLRAGDPVPLGANVFVKREVFRDYGGYDETLWRLCGKAALGVDDGEFGVRIKNSGEPIGYCHNALVVHPVHHERCSLRAQLRIAYHYGRRDPLVFFKADRPFIEPYHIRALLALGGGAIAGLFRGDRPATAADLLELARCLGRIAGRMSPSYRKLLKLRLSH